MVCTPGGEVKNFRKVFAGGWVKNIYFGVMGGGLYCWGKGNFIGDGVR